MGSSIKYIGVTITDYDYNGYKRKESTGEKLNRKSEAVLAFLLGKDVFVSLPTGYDEL